MSVTPRPCLVAAQAGVYAEASKAASRVEGHAKAVTILMVANAYEQDDLVGASWRAATGAPCLFGTLFAAHTINSAGAALMAVHLGSLPGDSCQGRQHTSAAHLSCR